jgi:hypothetical protein
MHIREHGKSIQLLRTVYDPSKKRGVQKVVGRLPQDIDKIPDNIMAALTGEEQQHLTDYLVTMKAVKARQYAVQNLVNIHLTIDSAISALDTADSTKAAEIWAALDRFGTALKKAGHPKPKPAKKS